MFDALKKLFGGGKTPGREARHTVKTCPDCGTRHGELHDLFCLEERCPFCRGQLAMCECIHRELKLLETEQRVVDEYVDDSVPPLSDIMQRWREALERKGRIPFTAFADDPWRAACDGDLAAMKGFLDDGFPPNSGNEVGYTTLMSACRGAALELVRLLLARGAQVTIVDQEGFTALHCAVMQSMPEGSRQAACVRMLLDAGADVNARTATGSTALMSAAWFGCTESVRELLKRGADVTLRDQKGRSALDLAVQRKHAEVAALLNGGK